MIRDGYIYKTIDTNDRRASLIALTPLGRETIEKSFQSIMMRWRDFSVLSSEEQDQLAEILKNSRTSRPRIANKRQIRYTKFMFYEKEAIMANVLF